MKKVKLNESYDSEQWKILKEEIGPDGQNIFYFENGVICESFLPPLSEKQKTNISQRMSEINYAIQARISREATKTGD